MLSLSESCCDATTEKRMTGQRGCGALVKDVSERRRSKEMLYPEGPSKTSPKFVRRSTCALKDTKDVKDNKETQRLLVSFESLISLVSFYISGS
jgi:hypothetical protein